MTVLTVHVLQGSVVLAAATVSKDYVSLGHCLVECGVEMLSWFTKKMYMYDKYDAFPFQTTGK